MSSQEAELRKALEGLSMERVAQLVAHRACCGTEHDPANGKIHGFCIVCGVDWPCEYAGKPPSPLSEAKEALEESRRAIVTWVGMMPLAPMMSHAAYDLEKAEIAELIKRRRAFDDARDRLAALSSEVKRG